MPIEVFIVLNGTKSASLVIEKYAEAVKQAIYSDPTLLGQVDDTRIEKLDRYYAAEAKETSQAMKIDLTLIYTEEFNG